MHGPHKNRFSRIEVPLEGCYLRARRIKHIDRDANQNRHDSECYGGDATFIHEEHAQDDPRNRDDGPGEPFEVRAVTSCLPPSECQDGGTRGQVDKSKIKRCKDDELRQIAN